MLKKIIYYLPLGAIPFLICNYYWLVGLIHNAWYDGKNSQFSLFSFMLLAFIVISVALSLVESENSNRVYHIDEILPKYTIIFIFYSIILANSIVLGICLSLKN
jgi:hypothetical protein